MSNDPTTEPPSDSHTEPPDDSHTEPATGPIPTSESTLNVDEPPKTPAGWYPTPDGQQRYWDGSSWTDLPWQPGDTAAAGASTGRVPRSKWSPRRRKALLIAGAATVIIGGLLVGGLVAKGASDRQAAAAKVTKIHTAELLAAAQAKASADAAAQAKQAKDDAERTSRAATVTEIEASVKKMAEKDVANKLLDGPIIAVTCSPIGAGSTNDLTQLTTMFECFAANKDNGDGTQSGYTFHANMNWSAGTYTYGLGKGNG